MALDDQLSALAAGELDDDTARALRARAAGDPALARLLARHEQLQRQLAEWDAPAMSEPAVQRLEARLDEALGELGDEPLADRTPGAAAAPADRQRRDEERPGVVDLGRARRRRETATPGAVAATEGGGTFAWPGWAAGAAVAAVLAAIVGTGVVLGGLPGGTGLDTLAGGDDNAEESADMTTDDAGDAALSGEASDSARTESAEEAADAPAAAIEEGAPVGPAQRSGVDVAEGDLLALVDLATQSTTAQEAGEPSDGTAEDDGGASAAAPPGQQCVDEALQRDTAQSDDREVQLLADGTYAGREAAFVVIRTGGSDGSDRYEVLAYDPGDCSLLARDETGR